ncbi:MAG: ATP-dependent helicase [Gammaproteobacteria bacterium]|nr:ATP-dependent helicase [Gammaproteobacteria bacterium]
MSTSIALADGRTMILDESQAACVAALPGHMRVIAGPGSGKTATMIAKCAFLISNGYEPESIIVTTFTNKAANELKERLALFVGKQRADRVWCGTFHGLALRIMRHYRCPSLTQEFRILSSGQEVNQIFKMFMSQKYKNLIGETKAVQEAYSSRRLKVNQVPISPITREGMTVVPASVVQEAFDYFETFKRENKLVDFDDLLHFWLDFLKMPLSDPLHAQTRYMIIDEMQDSNQVQNAIAQQFAFQGTHVLAVGDDCQSIYRFRGSDIKHIHGFLDMFEGAQQMLLESNYRSTPEITRLCQAIIEYNCNRIPKRILSQQETGNPLPQLSVFATSTEELSYIASLCEAARFQTNSIAVLFRTNRGVEALEKEMVKRFIPYKVLKGKPLLEQPHISLFLDFMRLTLCSNPPQLAADKVLGVFQGVGKAKVSEIWSHFKQSGHSNFVQFFMYCDVDVPKSLHVMQIEIEKHRHAFQSIQDGEDESYPAYISQICATAFNVLVPRIEHTFKNHVHVDRYSEDIAQVSQLMGQHETFGMFLDAAGLGEVTIQHTNNNTSIHLGTIHQSKGLEFDHVVVASVCEGSIPSPWSKSPEDIEEERRLLYVACSRARHMLNLTYSETGGSYAMGGRKYPRRLSHFLQPVLNCMSHPDVLIQDVAEYQVASIQDWIKSFEKMFGFHNVLYGKLEQLDFTPVSCELLPSPNWPRVSLITKDEVNTVLEHVVKSILYEASTWKDCMQDGIRQLKRPYSQNLVQGPTLFGEINRRKTQIYLDSVEATCHQIIQGTQDIQMADTQVGWIQDQVPLIVDRTVMMVVFDEVLKGKHLLSLYMQAALVFEEIQPTTLAIFDCFHGQLLRCPIPSSTELDLPAAVLDHPVGELLSRVIVEQ